MAKIEYEVFVGSRDGNPDNLEVVFIITAVEGLPHMAVFDKHTNPHEFTNGRGSIHASENVKGIDAAKELVESVGLEMDEFCNSQQAVSLKINRSKAATADEASTTE